MGVSEGRRGYRPNVDGNSRKDDEEEYHGRASDWQHPTRKAFCIVNQSFFRGSEHSRLARSSALLGYGHLVRCLHSTYRASPTSVFMLPKSCRALPSL
jgi:hypothetical protein